MLDKELARLPAACRSALILCYLEGRTRDQAARQTGCSLRTLDRRLDLGRQLLRDRLARRGLGLSVVVLAAALNEPAKANCARLAADAVQLVMQSAAIKAGVANAALKLANSGIPLTVATTAKIAIGIVLVAVMAIRSVGILSQKCAPTHATQAPKISNRRPQVPQSNQAAHHLHRWQVSLATHSPKEPLPVWAALIFASAARKCYRILARWQNIVCRVSMFSGVTMFESATGRPSYRRFRKRLRYHWRYSSAFCSSGWYVGFGRGRMRGLLASREHF